MATNPINPPLSADLPTNWVTGDTISPGGADVGLSEQHGYNYLMQQVNAAQEGVNALGESLGGLDASDVGAVPTTGGTMTGSLTIGNTTIGNSEILDTSSIAIAAPTEILIGVGNTGSLESLGSGFDITADMVHLLSDELFVNGAKITALGNPSVDTDAANKGYVDTSIQTAIGNAIAASY